LFPLPIWAPTGSLGESQPGEVVDRLPRGNLIGADALLKSRLMIKKTGYPKTRTTTNIFSIIKISK
jgi:hypothetical protein